MERDNTVREKLLAIKTEPSIIASPELRAICGEAAELITRLVAELERKAMLESEPTCSLRELENVEAQRDEAYAAIRAIERAGNYPLENRPCSVCRYIGLYCSSGGSSCRGFKWVGFANNEGGRRW